MKTAVLGASGLVGRTMLKLLAEQPWVSAAPRLLVSERSAGTRLPYRGGELECVVVGPSSFDGIDIALFSAGGLVSRQWAPVAQEAGAWVIDNSSAWRQDPLTPLVVPEINGELVGGAGCPGRIANPNCSTIQIAMAVAPLTQLAPVRAVHVTMLQAVSGAGQAAVAELEAQNSGRSGGAGSIFSRPMAHNVLPAIGAPQSDGSYEEEAKVGRELRRILGRGDDLQVSCTAVRVPVMNGHSAAVRVVFDEAVSREAAVRVLAAWPGLEVEASPHGFVTAREWSGRHEVHVGRIRLETGYDRALLMWVVADNLLKGAAYNAVQIAALLSDRA